MSNSSRIQLIILVLTLCLTQIATADEPLSFSGIYPHLAFYNDEGECGTGAVVPWADRLWAITYGPHRPFGSSDKLYEIDTQLNRVIRPESVGGTNANRMIHRESDQLFIGHYVIDSDRNVRVIPHSEMPGRMTGNARHLDDPENKIYFATMEEGFYSVDVGTLEVEMLYQDGNAMEPRNVAGPLLPGYHGKGLYSAQNRLVYANNGEHTAEARSKFGITSGCLAEWDGEDWNVVLRKQFTEVSGPGGIYGNKDVDDPLWAVGWDHSSLILMLLEDGEWHRYRLPKATHTYDGAHGWNTEWPRIRPIGEDDLMMTMHGMFWRIPQTFTKSNSSGIRPRSTYLKIIGDFCRWKGKLVMGCDDAARSEFGSDTIFNHKAVTTGQSNSNLWFVDPKQLDQLGSPIGRGGPWKDDSIKAGQYSDPYLFAGFKHRTAHVQHNAGQSVAFTFEIDSDGNGEWNELQTITVPSSGYAYHSFSPNTQGEWIRVKSDTDCESVSLIFHYANEDARSNKTDRRFDGLAKADQEYSAGIIRPRGDNLGTLHFAAVGVNGTSDAKEIGYYEIGPDMKLKQVDDKQAHQWLKDNHSIGDPLFTTDEASVLVLDSSGNRYRLPKGAPELQKATPAGWPRTMREVVTERSLFHCQGHWYELPRNNSGGFSKIRPIATSDSLIMDFCSWRGMLVLSGALDGERDNQHIVRSDDGQCALWFGAIDDLWKLGKARGQGGPWKNSAVKAGEVSDPYLITGYDEKSIQLSHQSGNPIDITVEIDITGEGHWVPYQTFEIKPNSIRDHSFPDGNFAYWLRCTSNQDATVTAQLVYQ